MLVLLDALLREVLRLWKVAAFVVASSISLMIASSILQSPAELIA
jgi:hypothetical protein